MPRGDLRSDFYAYGPKAGRLARLNLNREYTGVRGYPSDKEYMKLVGEAGTESDQARMRSKADEEERKYQTKKNGGKKPARKR